MLQTTDSGQSDHKDDVGVSDSVCMSVDSQNLEIQESVALKWVRF